jgi:hypothetical protein
MRLSDDKARRLTALVWRERARRWLPVLLVVLVLAGGVTFMLSSQVERADRTVAVHQREGTVLSIKQGGSRGASIVRVHLDDGRDVDAYSTSRIVVPKGAHVIVTEARHASGRLTYDVVRLVDQ